MHQLIRIIAMLASPPVHLFDNIEIHSNICPKMDGDDHFCGVNIAVFFCGIAFILYQHAILHLSRQPANSTILKDSTLNKTLKGAKITANFQRFRFGC